MIKLPSIFHNNNSYVTNNSKSFMNSNKKVEDNKIKFYNFTDYFNKEITIILKDGKEFNGTLIAKRDNIILLDNNEYININDIFKIK